MKNLPLHYQILIALIVGTVLGFIFNPGEFSLNNISLTLSYSESGFQVIEEDAKKAQTEYQFKDRKELLARFPEFEKIL
ncbi:hypothetical protein, partial [uncultured Gimesia sp.]|uniref:hypothetical protein n=1 Tax=uncultured Gimesia sp. TaxID=1678688 RepID=UPI002639F39C